MIENLVWFFCWIGAICLVLYLIPRAVIVSVDAYRKRHHEMATKGPSSAVCPQCAGEWGRWSEVNVQTRPNSTSYPSLYGTHEVRSQFRVCKECGFGERRVLG